MGYPSWYQISDPSRCHQRDPPSHRAMSELINVEIKCDTLYMSELINV